MPVQNVISIKLDSLFEGHSHWLKLAGVEVSAGLLRQGTQVCSWSRDSASPLST
jgi:hypothetical protein